MNDETYTYCFIEKDDGSAVFGTTNYNTFEEALSVIKTRGLVGYHVETRRARRKKKDTDVDF